MPWYVGEKLVEKGFEVVNTSANATVGADRKLLTGVSPKAGQAICRLAAEKLLGAYK